VEYDDLAQLQQLIVHNNEFRFELHGNGYFKLNRKMLVSV